MQPYEKYEGEDFWSYIGISPRGASLPKTLDEGLPYTVFKQLVLISGIEQAELAKWLAFPRSTLQRRAKAGRFTTIESDRLYRFAVIMSASRELFEHDSERSRNWLLSSAHALCGYRPIEMSTTTAGVSATLDLIGQLEHGVFI